jgi:hypothetical protein
LAAAGLIFLVAGPVVAQVADPPQARARLPITGTVSGKGNATFSGTFSIERFAARDNNTRVVAVGMVTGSIFDKSGRSIGTAVVGQVELPVQVGPGPSAAASSSSAAVAIAQVSCQVLHLDLGAVDLNVLGVQVTTAPITIDLTASSDNGGVLGQAICTVLEAVGTVLDLVGALNGLLGLVGGLLGGLTGA